MIPVVSNIYSIFCLAFAFLCEDGTIIKTDAKFKVDVDDTVTALMRMVESMQNKRHVPYVPPLSWEKRQGMWESDVKFYFHGHEDMYLLREAFSVYDNNMFATAWITSCLLEAYRFGNTKKPSEETVQAALLSIKDYHNRNVPYANSLMTFWPQRYNETSQTWISYPVNIHHLFDLANRIDFSIFEKILEDVGLGDIAKIIKQLLEIEDMLLQAFEIPPDFDDTFVNVGLGSLLVGLGSEFPTSAAQWRSQNTNLTSVFDALKKYAYRPLSDNRAVNTIDPRTYFYLRYFLEEAKTRGEDIALVQTWVEDINESARTVNKGVAMPFNINNVDVTVAANTVYGITAGVLSGVVDVNVLDDADIQQIYLNTSNLIASMILGNFSSRPDLALTYYPSAMEFYWFVARTYAELISASQTGRLPHPVLDQVTTILDDVLHSNMTSSVLRQVQEDVDGNMFIDDFLGNGDIDKNNKTVVRGQDRLFTTGMAINALLSTWTTFDASSRRLVWQKDVTKDIKESVAKMVGFVNNHIFSFKYQPWNAFFSGSIKDTTTFPNYPCNRVVQNGSYSLHGVEGIIPETQYIADLRREHSVIDFHGYNSYPDYWPFWSSKPYTYVTNMLALAKFSNTYDQ